MEITSLSFAFWLGPPSKFSLVQTKHTSKRKLYGWNCPSHFGSIPSMLFVSFFLSKTIF